MAKKLGNSLVVIAACLWCGTSAQAAIFYVNPGESIQTAINGAIDGDTIYVGAGSYDEALSVNKAIDLIGAGAGSTSLTYTGATTVEQLIFLGTNSGSTVNGSLTIEGFSLLDGSGIDGDNDLIKLRATSNGGEIAIRNNVFDANGDSGSKGIEESQGAGNFVISGNEFVGTSYGVWLNSAYDGAISDNTFTNARIGMGGSGAVGSDNPRDLSVTGNSISGASYGLVLANNIQDIAFSCNTITNTTSAAVLYWDYGPDSWSGVTFNNNNIVGNAAGFMRYGSAGDLPTLVDGSNNWWGDASGPSGLGPGSGDSVLVGNLTFDPWLTSPAQCDNVIPEPASLAVWSILGLVGAISCARRRRKAA